MRGWAILTDCGKQTQSLRTRHNHVTVWTDWIITYPCTRHYHVPVSVDRLDHHAPVIITYPCGQTGSSRTHHVPMWTDGPLRTRRCSSAGDCCQTAGGGSSLHCTALPSTPRTRCTSPAESPAWPGYIPCEYLEHKQRCCEWLIDWLVVLPVCFDRPRTQTAPLWQT